MPRPIIRAPVDGKCRDCGSTEFTTRNRCKPCHRERERVRRNEDAERRRARDREWSRRWRRANPHKVREQLLRQEYGLSAEDFARMLLAQGNKCPICETREPSCVDHCHATKRVRGILCRPCNIGLGQLRDDTQLLLEAAPYVEEQPTISDDRRVRDAGSVARAAPRSSTKVLTRTQRELAAFRWRTYGLCGAEFETLFDAQGGVCLICRVREASSVDHCHASGRIRGLLCRACNAGLGFFRDDARLMRVAAAYRSHRNPE